MIVVKDVGRQIKSNRLVAERDHVRMNDGLDGSSQPKYSVNLAYSQVTRIVWALKIDRAARGRQQIRDSGLESYELGSGRGGNSQQTSQDQDYRKGPRIGAARHGSKRRGIRAWCSPRFALTYSEQSAVVAWRGFQLPPTGFPPDA